MQNMHLRYLMWITEVFFLVESLNFNEGNEFFAYLFLKFYRDGALHSFIYLFLITITFIERILPSLIFRMYFENQKKNV